MDSLAAILESHIILYYESFSQEKVFMNWPIPNFQGGSSTNCQEHSVINIIVNI